MIMEKEWQLIGPDAWAFGISLRGVIRERLATVSYSQVGSLVQAVGIRMDWKWCWKVEQRGETQDGTASSLAEAIVACERLLNCGGGADHEVSATRDELLSMVADAYHACHSECMSCPWCSGHLGGGNDRHDEFCRWPVVSAELGFSEKVSR